jgi:hypothetical protein
VQLDLRADFADQRLHGMAELTVEQRDPAATEIRRSIKSLRRMSMSCGKHGRIRSALQTALCWRAPSLRLSSSTAFSMQPPLIV